MNASSDGVLRPFSASMLAAIMCGCALLAPTGTAQAGALGGALGGAIIGGIIGGDDGAAAGAIVGGVGGAMHQNRRRAEEMRRRDYHARRELERRRQVDEERLRLERERNQLLAVQQKSRAAPAVRSADPFLVKQTQSALTLLGFDVGPADGVLNNETVEAIRAYQQSFGLLGTGVPSPELLQHMKQHL